MKRTVIIVVSAFAGLVLLAGLWLTLFFDVNQFRPQLEAALGGAVGRRVTIGRIRLAVFSGSLALDDVAIGDDPAFGAAPFVTAKTVSVGVRLTPLIVSQHLAIESLRLEQPHVTLRRSRAGTWNFSAMGGGPSGPTGASGGAALVAGASIGQMAIVDGQVIVGARSGGREDAYDHVNVELNDVSLGSTFPFQVTARTPGGGSLDLKGQAGPIDLADLAATPFQAAVALRRLDLASTGFVERSSGLSGAVDFSGQTSSDGRTVTSTGTLQAARLTLVPGASPARVPIELAYESSYTPKTGRGTLTQGIVRIGPATARLTGTYDVTGSAPVVHASLVGKTMPVTAFEPALPAVGVVLPAGASLRAGTLDLDLKVDGPIDGLVLAGPVTFSDLTLEGFDLGGRLGTISALAGLPHASDTVLQTLSATVRIGRGTQLADLLLVAPALGTFTGGGTISPQGALDFTMLAKLAASRGAAGAVGRVASLGQPANGIPFLIQGTASRPEFVPDVGRAVTNVLTSPETQKKAGELLGALLKGKKKK